PPPSGLVMGEVPFYKIWWCGFYSLSLPHNIKIKNLMDKQEKSPKYYAKRKLIVVILILVLSTVVRVYHKEHFVNSVPLLISYEILVALCLIGIGYFSAI